MTAKETTQNKNNYSKVKDLNRRVQGLTIKFLYCFTNLRMLKKEDMHDLENNTVA